MRAARRGLLLSIEGCGSDILLGARGFERRQRCVCEFKVASHFFLSFFDERLFSGMRAMKYRAQVVCYICICTFINNNYFWDVTIFIKKGVPSKKRLTSRKQGIKI